MLSVIYLWNRCLGQIAIKYDSNLTNLICLERFIVSICSFCIVTGLKSSSIVIWFWVFLRFFSALVLFLWFLTSWHIIRSFWFELFLKIIPWLPLRYFGFSRDLLLDGSRAGLWWGDWELSNFSAILSLLSITIEFTFVSRVTKKVKSKAELTFMLFKKWIINSLFFYIKNVWTFSFTYWWIPEAATIMRSRSDWWLI